MARAGSIAFLTLVLLIPQLLMAQSTSSVRRPRLRPSATVLNPRWTVGYSLWNEKAFMNRADGRAYEIASSIRALSVGYQIDWMQRQKGWFLESQLLMGDANSMSRDDSLTYLHSGASLMGASATVVRHWNFEKPRLFLGMGLAAIWRQLKYEVPAGYSMSRSEQRFISHVVLDLSFPIAPRFEAIQRFGIPLDNNGHFWQIGLRHR